MSFILDALKKAESERLLGDLPGIHTQQLVQPLQSGVSGRWQRPGWLALCLAVAILCVLAWQMSTPRGQSTTLPAALSTPPVVAIAPAVAASIVPSREAPLLEAPLRMPVITEILVPPAMPKPVVTEKKEAPLKPVVKNIPVPAQVPKKSVPVVAAASAIGMTDLPPAIQRELPPLAISGSMYSTNPADRMLLVDKRMLHEGDEIVAGLVLDTILQKGAILRYKGYLFQINR